jgi:hypothetical protein
LSISSFSISPVAYAQNLVCDLLTINLWLGSEQPSRNGPDVLGPNPRIELRGAEHADKIVKSAREGSELVNIPSRHARASHRAIEVLRRIEQQHLIRILFFQHRATLVSDVRST